ADDSNNTAHADSPRFPVENQRYLGMAGLPRKSHCISSRVTERFLHACTMTDRSCNRVTQIVRLFTAAVVDHSSFAVALLVV
ncbi:hypothetical protein, partial [Mesorhizobium sp. M7D.F.Ca.US.004.03.1.1]|uniref:hypothetical protein n=1 Tax=Mesorhizobium sp. M7D.F.Ca.US.004.03.1.1 TaxID=2496702 RepID=UPI0019CF730A